MFRALVFLPLVQRCPPSAVTCLHASVGTGALTPMPGCRPLSPARLCFFHRRLSRSRDLFPSAETVTDRGTFWIQCPLPPLPLSVCFFRRGPAPLTPTLARGPLPSGPQEAHVQRGLEAFTDTLSVYRQQVLGPPCPLNRVRATRLCRGHTESLSLKGG